MLSLKIKRKREKEEAEYQTIHLNAGRISIFFAISNPMTMDTTNF